ncbi:MAG: serine hydrolase [Anaerolineales bacterium]|nr:serine hydrolase [Anaerolineales bacterium]
MKIKSLRVTIVSLLYVFLLISCNPTPEPWGDEWKTAGLNEVGIDEAQITTAIERIRDGSYNNIHCILIVRDGKLVFEEYFDGYTWDYVGEKFKGELTEYGVDTIHNLASVTKSFTSALIGIAIDEGFIPGVDEPVYAYFPDYAYLSDETKDSMTLEHLLTMTSGLEWNGMEIHVSTRNPRNDLLQLFMVSDPVEYILAKPLVNKPGESWYYNGGGTNLLGEVIREATGMRMDRFAEMYLFAPMGIANYEWHFINQDMIHAAGNLKLRPRDMAKFGYLYLNGGLWGDKRILSKEWIEESVEDHASPTWGDGYGYQWWLRTYDLGSTSIESFYAAGWGGQRIMVFPSLDMVVVFTGGNYVEEEPVDEIIIRHILPAVQ